MIRGEVLRRPALPRVVDIPFTGGDGGFLARIRRRCIRLCITHRPPYDIDNAVKVFVRWLDRRGSPRRLRWIIGSIRVSTYWLAHRCLFGGPRALSERCGDQRSGLSRTRDLSCVCVEVDNALSWN